MKILASAMLASALAACTPQASLLMSVLPEGTMSTLLSHMEGVEDGNRRRVVAFEQSGDWEGLARYAEDQVARDSHTPDWWLIAGYAYSQLGRHARAAECYQEAVRLEPDETLGWSLLAQSYRSAGELQRAVTTLDRALLARRDDAQLHVLLGETYGDMGRWRSALSAYDDALRIDPRHAPAWYGAGRAYQALDRMEDARKAARTLQAIDAPLAAKLERALTQKERNP